MSGQEGLVVEVSVVERAGEVGEVGEVDEVDSLGGMRIQEAARRFLLTRVEWTKKTKVAQMNFRRLQK